ncbi:hypothetical protein [Rhizobium sp. C4]|uniref:hypothetical protein n=1 Tax=Rhizobium sp. C4 TaxID=1349800 RepID=UPI001E50B392|nr:hypothetical protein [Rhizobium sp. C4]MCD2174849.1 hypothetical protein [Rhizobium sp. C4]
MRVIPPVVSFSSALFCRFPIYSSWQIPQTRTTRLRAYAAVSSPIPVSLRVPVGHARGAGAGVDQLRIHSISNMGTFRDVDDACELTCT